ncbi:hypothetical protein EWM64_g631 [Hericium alpestre]|uniref:Glutamine synthetase n=1 Tax=Hericium alpestre TaxID=135208 RepID=A0A4Z0A8J2_9AGAM|nr:hypothetical protein EWM64_g631 [Hericium alpestre]
MSARPTPYGRVYTPRNQHPYRPPAVDSLADSGIRYIRLQWTDFTNLTRFRVLPLATFLALLESESPGVGITKAAFGLVGATLAEGFSVTGEYVYVPDTESLRICDYAPGHASVMGWFERKEPEAHMVKLCPRTLLKRIEEEEAAAASIEFLVGIKTEFVLLDSIDPITPASNGPWSSSAKLRSGSISTVILEDIAECDVVTGPLAPLQAADALVFTRETIYNIASKHGKRATFAPRLFTDECGSAANVSISVHRMDISNDHTDDNVMNALERSFLQGVLNHAPGPRGADAPHARIVRPRAGQHLVGRHVRLLGARQP